MLQVPKDLYCSTANGNTNYSKWFFRLLRSIWARAEASQFALIFGERESHEGIPSRSSGSGSKSFRACNENLTPPDLPLETLISQHYTLFMLSLSGVFLFVLDRGGRI